jgi:hypothetical protein
MKTTSFENKKGLSWYHRISFDEKSSTTILFGLQLPEMVVTSL